MFISKVPPKSKRGKRRQNVKCVPERLEPRRLLAGVTEDFTGYTVTIGGDTEYQKYSYSAPWTLDGVDSIGNIQGYGDSESWRTSEGVQFQFLESHYFNNPENTSLNGKELKIVASDGTNLDGFYFHYKGNEKYIPLNTLDKSSSVTLNTANFPSLETSGDTSGVNHFSITPKRTNSTFGNDVISVFTGPQAGYLPEYMTPWDVFTASDYDYAESPVGSQTSGYRQGMNTLRTKWKVGTILNTSGREEYYGLFVGGLFELATGQNQHNPTVLNVDADFYPEIPSWDNPNVKNLSSAYTVVDFGSNYSSHKQRMDALIDNLNKGFYDPSITSAAVVKGTFTPPTRKMLVMSGTGRVNGWNIISRTRAQYGWTETPSMETSFYDVGAEMLRYSSYYSRRAAGKAGIDVSGVTFAWTPRLNHGAIQLNELTYPMVSLAEAYTNGTWEPDVNQIDGATFANTNVKFFDYKQLGSWVGESDGPEIMSPYTDADKLYLHVNDDSIKLRSYHSTFNDVTVLQGDAGRAVSYAYGLVNGDVYGTSVTGLWVHRNISTNTADVGEALVWIGVSPGKYWWREAESRPLGLSFTSTEDVFVPNIIGGQSSHDANQVVRPMAIEIGWWARYLPAYGFDTTTTFPISKIGGSGTGTGPGTPAEIYGSWNIASEPSLQSEMYLVGRQNGGIWPSVNPAYAPTYENATYSDNTAEKYRTVSFADFSYSPWSSSGDRNITLHDGGDIYLPYINTAAGGLALNETISRPLLHPTSTIQINREGQIGPNPVAITFDELANQLLINSGYDTSTLQFIVSGVASGYVEKLVGTKWARMPDEPSSLNIVDLIDFLKSRSVETGDQIRWVPDSQDSQQVSADAFRMIGWDDPYVSDESEIEVSVGSDLQD